MPQEIVRQVAVNHQPCVNEPPVVTTLCTGLESLQVPVHRRISRSVRDSHRDEALLPACDAACHNVANSCCNKPHTKSHLLATGGIIPYTLCDVVDHQGQLQVHHIVMRQDSQHDALPLLLLLGTHLSSKWRKQSDILGCMVTAVVGLVAVWINCEDMCR